MKSENGNSLAVSHYSRWLWPCAPATATHQTCMQAILKPRKSSWQLKPTLAMKRAWWQLKLGRAPGAVQVCMEAVNGEVRGGRHRGHMEEELATQGTCGSVTQYAASSHANRSVCDCLFVKAYARKVFDGIPYSWMESSWMLGSVNMLLIFLIGVDNSSLVCSSLRTLLWFEYLNLMPKFLECWQCEVAGCFLFL